MRSCFLFGHADAPESILPDLTDAIEREAAKGTSAFYVGYHGNFDRMAAAALRQAKRKFNITAMLVLAYHPAEHMVEKPEGFDGTFYPPLEGVPRKAALVRANRYMAGSADSVICYVRHYGNSRTPLEYAQRRGIAIINLA